MFEQANIIASVLPKDQSIVNDYNAGWVPGAHPSAFPYNKGGRPKGMSEKKWSQCILRRYPVEQFAQNLPLIVDMFNILQRHTAYTSSHIHFKFRPRDATIVAQMTPFDIQQVLDIMQMKPRPYGINLSNRLAAIGKIGNNDGYFRFLMDWLIVGPAAKVLYHGITAARGRMLGTAESFRSLRSKVMGTFAVYGPYTMQMNLCPDENIAHWTFDLANKSYTFDIAGNPVNRPHITQCRKIVAENPAAVRRMIFHAFI
jgi:hypothetical protein